MFYLVTAVKRNHRQFFKLHTRFTCATSQTSQRKMSTELSPIEMVRRQLKEANVDAFVVGSADAHNSEYVCDRDKRRDYISRFTGSAGTALICVDQANLLWTDGRYFLQAEQELSSSDWTLMKQGQPGVLDPNNWLQKFMKPGQCVGIDPSLMPASSIHALKDMLEAHNVTLKSLEVNPIDVVWDASGSRPESPCKRLSTVGIDRAGQSALDKVEQVRVFIREQLPEASSAGIVLSALDEIMWLLNIRGDDIQYNPVAVSYLVVTLDAVYIFINKDKLDSALIDEHWQGLVQVYEYEDIIPFLKQFAEESCATSSSNKMLADPAHLNGKVYESIRSAVKHCTSPVALSKSLKNETELAGIRAAHVRDGVALTAFFHWLEEAVKANPHTITEYDIESRVLDFRSKMDGFVGPSFSTIAGYGANGAIIHYHAKKDKCSTLGVDSLFLLDSGAQYLDGTTDVTRTVHFGKPTQRMKDCFTAVLKGHISLARAVFPSGTTGARLDSFARAALWSMGLDYNHGTGHGVGAFLNVHEGPQGIGTRPRGLNEAGFQAGMTTSNEPGYYEDGQFGIRIENVCITVNKHTANNFGGKQFLGFETVTMTPIKKNLINIDQLTTDELQFVNEYHRTVREKLLPLMQAQFPEAVSYLLRETEELGE